MTLAFSPPPCPDSILRRLDPRWKLAGLLAAMIAVALLRQPLPCVLAALVACILAWMARLPFGWAWLRLGGVALFVAPFALTAPFLTPEPPEVTPLWQWGPVEITMKGINLAVLLGAKALALALLSMLIVATAPLDATLKAARALHVPGLLVQLALLSYRYAVHLGGELKRLRIALRLRGFQQRTDAHSVRTMGRVMGTMLVRAHERGERVAQAMVCRGFDGHYRSLTPFQTRHADVLFFLLVFLGAAGLLAWDVAIG